MQVIAFVSQKVGGVRKQIIAILTLIVCVQSFASDPHPVEAKDVYTLYRSSIVDRGLRIHVATFDSVDGAEYNRENCQIARGLFQAQPGVSVQYWCERGYFSKE